MSSSSLLNLVLYLPLAGAVVLASIPRSQTVAFKWGAFGVSVVTFLLSLGLLLPHYFDWTDNSRYQFVTAIPWISQFNINYKIGADGISLALVLLTTLLSAIAVLSSFEAVHDRVKEYYIFLLVLETGMLGVFVALDLILFY